MWQTNVSVPKWWGLLGDNEHISDNCYRLSNVEPPAHLLSNAPKVVSIVEEIQKLTNELTLDKGELSALLNKCRSLLMN